MTIAYPWKRKYTKPTDLSTKSVTPQTGISGWRTERMNNPEEVFIDIYGLLDYLISPGNLQLRGRRGTGKTIYFLKAQYQIGSSLGLSDYQDTISSYVDLKSLHDFKDIPSMILRAELIYRQIIKAILTGSQYKQGVQRYCLQDFKSLIGLTKRFPFNMVMKDLLKFSNQENIISENILEKIIESEQELAGERTYKELRSIDSQYFPSSPQIIERSLLKLLDFLSVENLIVFIDEFSSPTIFQNVQVPLLDRLLKTFKGKRLSIKLATVPGTTIIYEDTIKTKNEEIPFTNRLDTFDFESQIQNNPDVINTGNFEIFLRNISNTNTTYQKYLISSNPELGFNQFISNTFENIEDFIEFLKSGEGLPRQLLETYVDIQTIKKTINPNGKINRLIIQLASRQSLQITYQTQIRGSKDCEKILIKIYQANSRMVKIEKKIEYESAIALLVHWGFIYACPTPATYEPKIGHPPLEYFYTSYRTEIANQWSRSPIREPVMIDDLNNLAKEKFIELYPKAKLILLSD